MHSASTQVAVHGGGNFVCAKKATASASARTTTFSTATSFFGSIPGRLFLRDSSDAAVTTVTERAYGPMIEMICFVLGSTINT
jgi:hypothetical protein